MKGQKQFGLPPTCWLLGNISFACCRMHQMDKPDVYCSAVGQLMNNTCKSIFKDMDDDVAEKTQLEEYIKDQFAPSHIVVMFTDALQKGMKYTYNSTKMIPRDLQLIVDKAEIFSAVNLFHNLLIHIESERLAYLSAVYPTPILACLWTALQRQIGYPLDGSPIALTMWFSAISDNPDVFINFHTLIECLNLSIIYVEEVEFHKMANPFDTKTIAKLVLLVRKLLYNFYWEMEESRVPKVELVAFQRFLQRCQIRDQRKQFVRPTDWLLEQKEQENWQSEMFSSERTSRAVRVYRELSFTLPFEVRVSVMRAAIDQERHALKNQSPILVPIRRGREVADGFAAINKIGRQFRRIIRIRYIDRFGNTEEGQDLGGLFKDFMDTICRQVFSENYGLFKVTPGGEYYPNPLSIVDPDMQVTMEFVGRVLGKAVFEGILLDIPFAPFFLSKLQNNYTFFDDLVVLDKQLYDNLLFVKHYANDMEDLCLTFSIDQDILGKSQTIDLIPNGRNVNVTKRNRIQYINAVAEYHLAKAFRRQTRSFLRGFFDIIHQEHIQRFSPSELKMLISGSGGDIDVDDWARHTEYDEPYHTTHSVIKNFWSMVKTFSTEEKKTLLRFITGSSRPPLMGFKYLNPKFHIRPVQVSSQGGMFSRMQASMGYGTTNDPLPTASTCFNMIKLPNYGSQHTLSQKIRQAMTESKGFYTQ